LSGLGAIYEKATSLYELQSYYDKFVNLVGLYTKRTPKKKPTAGWESFLVQEDRDSLVKLRDAVDDLSALQMNNLNFEQRLKNQKRNSSSRHPGC
jgi:hypothetical protein